ncbi:MAG: SMC-Scp complex subunit ScpB [Deltaproteobacteria bacterium]|jgi:segregation and condensation protein B|nr:SMC-Scp complex subunit ScpB [Deltaproteobacteria bacterium]
MQALKTVVEGLLFASDQPLSPERLLTAFIEEVTQEEIKAAIVELQAEYERDQRAFELREVAGGYQFRTRPQLAIYALRLRKKGPTKLSRPALETLAVIAYRQPILRAEIEKIRGVDAGGVIRSLMERDLIRISSRNDNLPGRPMLYSTTKRFLETFDLPSISALPTIEEMERLMPPQQPSPARLFE